MSFMKRHMEDLESQRDVATQIAKDAGLLIECPIHHELRSTGELDYVEAYKLGNYRITKGEYAGVFPTRRDMTEAIDYVLNNAGGECYDCAKMMDD